jgi:hypothetical protein
MPLPLHLISFNGQAYKPISLAQTGKPQSQGDPFIITKIVQQATNVELRLQPVHDLEGAGLVISVSKQIAKDLKPGKKVLLEQIETNKINPGDAPTVQVRSTSDIESLLSELIRKSDPLEISLVYAFAKQKLPINFEQIRSWKKICANYCAKPAK